MIQKNPKNILVVTKSYLNGFLAIYSNIFHRSIICIQYPGDSKSIKFLGVFGVDCFFSKSDAFLTKTPQTAKNCKI